MKDIIRIHVSLKGAEELFRLLAQRHLIFMLLRMDQPSSERVNSVQTVEVIRQDSTSASVGSAIVAWIKGRTARTAIIYTKGDELIHAGELDPGELERYLDVSNQVSLIDPAAPHPKQVEPLAGG